MRFIDEAVIEVEAGAGGPGMASFRRETNEPRGGPDGGNGGRGGDVVVVANEGISTLLDHRYRRSYRAERGVAGGSSGCTGRSGEDLVITLPVGTVVSDGETGSILADLVEPNMPMVVATGGRGGRGNASYATSTRQAPRNAQPGEAGERHTLSLSLKLMADVGLVGLPNAGKSTFIRQVSRSRATVADYPFTTLVPNLGVARVDESTFVIADVPGLVEGAHEGKGLGDRFLKHLERTRVLVHLLSLSPDGADALEAYDTIQTELEAHSPDLFSRPQVVVLNKIDLLEDRHELVLWAEAFDERDVEVMWASGLSGEGITEILRRVASLLEAERADDEAEQEPWSPLG